MPREVIYQRHRAGKLGIQDMDPDLLTPNLASLGYRVYGLLSQQEPDQFLHPPPHPCIPIPSPHSARQALPSSL